MPVTAAMRFAGQIDRMSEPAEILDNLQKIAATSGVSVLGTMRLSTKHDDFSGPQDGRKLFKSANAPSNFFHEWKHLTREHGASSMRQLALRDFQSFTYTEAMRTLRPTGQDRWIFDLHKRHGIRDGFYVPCGRWMLNYWSSQILKLTAQQRALLNYAACVAVKRLEEIINQHRRGDDEHTLTSRELTILHRLSFGESPGQIARELELHPGTVGTYLRRAQRKLSSQNRTHTVAEAVRRNLII